MPPAPSTRDNAMTALILGFFASAWFGWAQEDPPASWQPALVVGALLSLAVAVAGGVMAWRAWSGDSALRAPGGDAAVRADCRARVRHRRGRCHWAAPRGLVRVPGPWICLVVGIHFWPLAPVLRRSSLRALGVLLVAVAVLAAVMSGVADVIPSAIVGAGAGAALLGYATWCAVAALRGRDEPARAA